MRTDEEVELLHHHIHIRFFPYFNIQCPSKSRQCDSEPAGTIPGLKQLNGTQPSILLSFTPVILGLLYNYLSGSGKYQWKELKRVTCLALEKVEVPPLSSLNNVGLICLSFLSCYGCFDSSSAT